jgi:hypothetical protein
MFHERTLPIVVGSHSMCCEPPTIPRLHARRRLSAESDVESR